MQYPIDTPGEIPAILADLRARALRTTPAPVDPEPVDPEPVDPEPLPSLFDTTFGMNMSGMNTMGERIYADLTQIREWRENQAPYGYPQPGGDYLTEDNEIRVTPPAGLLMFFQRPNSEGPVLCEAEWTGNGMMYFQAGQGEAGATRIASQEPVTVGGVTRRRFTVTHEWDDQTDLAAVVVSTDPANPIRFKITEVSGQ